MVQMGGIDRRAVVRRHDVVLRSADAVDALTVGNGDFAVTVDATGLQTLTDLHDPTLAEQEGRRTLNTATLSSWCWHDMPNPRGYVLEDAMTAYETGRGTVRYPDRFDIRTVLGGPVADEFAAGTWLHVNPQRVDLGRLGFVSVLASGDVVEIEPDRVRLVEQRLDLWCGRIDTLFELDGERVHVVTVAHPRTDAVAVRVESVLLGGRLGLRLAFPYASDRFFATSDWSAADRHVTAIESDDRGATVHRALDATSYLVRAAFTTSRVVEAPERHRLAVVPATAGAPFEITVRYSQGPDGPRPPTFAETVAAAEAHWHAFWSSGAAIDLSAVDDPRAHELERRIVLSQYLTAVSCSGRMPPQETGLVTNSWQGKAHLEMHWWHAAHFATWGRPALLRRGLDWYRSIAPAARATARSQHYGGIRWPKQVGPDGRESPTDIGALLIWQQPHLMYLLELLHRAGEVGLEADFGDLVEGSAEFMASFVEQRADGWHLPSPVMPAQEFYDARSTEDPTFELAYWWWGLEIAQRWRERAGGRRDPAWTAIQEGLVTPTVRDGTYAAVATPPFLRKDDHPSMLAAFGFVPPSPLIDEEVMRRTLRDVIDTWSWDTAWGWDFPVLAMTATRLRDPELAVDALLLDAQKNGYTDVGHNAQMGNLLPIYLPGNGGLLAAVSLMVGGSDSGVPPLGGFPERWDVRHEGFTPWP